MPGVDEVGQLEAEVVALLVDKGVDVAEDRGVSATGVISTLAW